MDKKKVWGTKKKKLVTFDFLQCVSFANFMGLLFFLWIQKKTKNMAIRHCFYFFLYINRDFPSIGFLPPPLPSFLYPYTLL